MRKEQKRGGRNKNDIQEIRPYFFDKEDNRINTFFFFSFFFFFFFFF